AVAALAQPDLGQDEQRKAGAYYTDFRLAQDLAAQFSRRFSEGDRVIDFASGGGILLSALALHVSRGNSSRAAAFIAHNVCAADLRRSALMATTVALAAMVKHTEGLQAL